MTICVVTMTMIMKIDNEVCWEKNEVTIPAFVAVLVTTSMATCLSCLSGTKIFQFYNSFLSSMYFCFFAMLKVFTSGEAFVLVLTWKGFLIRMLTCNSSRNSSLRPSPSRPRSPSCLSGRWRWRGGGVLGVRDANANVLKLEVPSDDCRETAYGSQEKQTHNLTRHYQRVMKWW